MQIRNDEHVIEHENLWILVIGLLVINAIPCFMFIIVVFTMDNVVTTSIYSTMLNYKIAF